jgi:hypothetical protein
MTNEQQLVINMLNVRQRLTPQEIAIELCISLDTAQKLCEHAWCWQARNSFLERHLGMNIEQYEGVCNG